MNATSTAHPNGLTAEEAAQVERRLDGLEAAVAANGDKLDQLEEATDQHEEATDQLKSAVNARAGL